MEDVIEPLAEVSDLNMAILINKTDRSKASKAFTKEYRSLDFVPTFDTEIPISAKYKNPIAKGLVCFEDNPYSPQTEIFLSFFQELCNAIGVKCGQKRISSKIQKQIPKQTKKSSKRGREANL